MQFGEREVAKSEGCSLRRGWFVRSEMKGRRLIDALFPQLIHGYFGFSIPVSGQRRIAVESEAENDVSQTIATRIRIVE